MRRVKGYGQFIFMSGCNMVDQSNMDVNVKIKPEALKSLYRSSGYKKNQLAYVKTMSCSGSHLGIPINIKNTKFVKDLPMIDFQLGSP